MFDSASFRNFHYEKKFPISSICCFFEFKGIEVEKNETAAIDLFEKAAQKVINRSRQDCD